MPTAPKYVYAGFDKKAAELRMLTLFSGDPRMSAALAPGVKTHEMVAAWMFGMNPEDIAKDSIEREAAKTIEYAFVYSGGDPGVASAIARGEAPHIDPIVISQGIEKFIQAFPTLIEWIEMSLHRWYMDAGWVAYLLNARKHVAYPDYQKADIDSLKRSTPGRIAINTYGQNSVGLLLKLILRMVGYNAYLSDKLGPMTQGFDALVGLVRADSLPGILATLEALCTVELEYTTISGQTNRMTMATEWKTSARSWGHCKELTDAQMEQARNIAVKQGIHIPDRQVIRWTQPARALPHAQTINAPPPQMPDAAGSFGEALLNSNQMPPENLNEFNPFAPRPH